MNRLTVRPRRKPARAPRLTALALAGLVLALALGCSSSAKSASGASNAGSGGASDPFTLRVGIVTKVAVDGILGWANDQQILQKYLSGLGVTKIDFSTFPTGPPLNAALTSGSVDVVAMGDTPALQLRSNGFASRAIGIYTVNGDDWLIGRKGGPTTLTGLEGKKVSAAPGTAPERYLIGLLQQQNLSSKIKIKISNLQTNDAATALRAGKIDAFVATGAMAATFQSQGYPVIDKASQHTGLYTTSVNIASQKFLDKHPGFAQAWGQAMTAAATSLKANPDKFYAFNAAADKVSVPIAKVALPLTSVPDGPFTADAVAQLQGAYDFLKQNGTIKQPYELNAWLDKS